MATWDKLSPQYAEDEEEDDDDIDAYDKSSLLSTPHETIIEEDEENEEDDVDEAQAQPFDGRDCTEFSVSLQELKNIRSHLYSAADYCESAYIYSDQKQAIFENLKDYSVKALVNAVDHVGTVAAKLDELLSKYTKDMSVLEFNMSCLTQQLQAYHDSAICEGLNQYQYARRRPRYGLHYTRSEQAVGGKAKYVDKGWTIAQSISQTVSLEQHQYGTASDTNEPRSLLWHLTSETPERSTPTEPHVVNRSTSSNARSDKKLPGFLTRSLSGGQFSSPKSSPGPSILNNTRQEPVLSHGSSKTLSSLLSLDETRYDGSQTHKKGLLSTFLGKSKSGKPKRLNTLTYFK